MSVYDELVDLIAAGPGAERIVAYRMSQENQSAISDLLSREKEGALSAQETAELDRYLQLEHLIRLAKARAHLYLQSQATVVGGRQ